MRILFFVHPGTNSRSILLDMVRGFREAGHEAITWDLAPLWRRYDTEPLRRSELMREASGMIAARLEADRIDLSIAMWANAIFTLSNGVRNGEPATFFDLIDQPHLMFWLDAPQWASDRQILEHARTPIVGGQRVHHLINSHATAREMKDVLGFSNVLAKPYGVNESIFHPHPVTRDLDLVFALGPGDPPPSELMLQELERKTPDVRAIRAERAKEIEAILRVIASTAEASTGCSMRDLFGSLVDSQIDAPQTPILDRLDAIALENGSHGDAAKALRTSPGLFVSISACIRQIESWERAFTISFLSRHLSCALFGSASLDGWNFQGQRLGELGYEQQARAYSRARIGLNVMRQQDDTGVNLKPLEISASGTPCLMRARPGIEEILDPAAQIATFQSPAEALDRANELIADPGARDRMAADARSRVLREHTWTHRAVEILEAMAFPARSAPLVEPI